MSVKGILKKSIIGKFLKWLLRAFLNWRFYFKQLFYSYKFYHTKRLANNCDIKCKISYAGERGTIFPHPVGVVIGMGVELGSNCTIYQNATLGTKRLKYGDDYPKLGNNVIVGANAVVIGNIIIGNNVIIGALTLVNQNIPDDSMVVGNPMKIMSKNKHD